MLVIAPNYLHNDIRNYYRKDNPLFDIKIISKHDLKSALYLNVKNRAIIYLMDKHQLPYDVADMYLKYIPYAKEGISHKIDELNELKEDLEKQNLLFDNIPLRLLYSHKSALIIGYSKEDVELNHLLNELDIKAKYYSYNEQYQVSEINEFDHIEDEVYFVLNEIAHLLDNKVDVNDIVIVRKDNGYDYYLKKFAPLFGYQINIDSSTSWTDSGLYVEFMRLYEENEDIELALSELKEICKEDDLYDEFAFAIRSLVIEDVPHEIQHQYLTHRIKSMSYNLGKFDKAIKVSNNFPYCEDKYIFVIGFMQSLFPRTNKDSGYLDNEELTKLHLLNSKEETRFDQESILSSFKLQNKFCLSYSTTIAQGEFGYISPIANKLNLKIVSNPFKDYFYSKSVLSYIVCDLEDSNHYYDERGEKYYRTLNVIEIPYNKYDNQYTFTKALDLKDHLKLSTSSITDYYECPFKYYLKRVIKIDPYEQTDSGVLGTIVHKALELYKDNEDYNIEETFLKLVDEADVEEDLKTLWKFNLPNQVKLVLGAIKLHKNYMKNPKFRYEFEVSHKLNENTTITGKIDKVILLDNKYAVAVDYKTGSSGAFDPSKIQYGLSTQLPCYAYLINHSELEDYKVTGLFLQHVLFSNEIEAPKKGLISNDLKLAGKAVIDTDSFICLDNTIADNTSSFVKGVSFKDGDLKPDGNSNGLMSENELNNMVSKIEELFAQASISIRNNDFVIKPINIGKTSGCQFCSGKDICFLKYQQKYFPAGEEVESDE